MKFKKPKFWDLKKPNFISFLLLPLTLPIILNNYFLGFKSKKKNTKIKTICVGNIYLGGTGKTPTTIKLYEILENLKFNVSTAKKFYKSQSDENTILQNKTNFITAKNRTKIINNAIETKQNIVIFDDGLQDQNISYDVSFVCFDGENFVGNGCLMPSGPLREKLNSLQKYDGIFWKSDTEISKVQLDIIKKYNPNIHIFETHFEILNLKKFNLNNNYLIFSGIGSPKGFKNILVKNGFKIIKELIFPDHYDYKKDEIENIKKKAKDINAKIITTEKDFVKVSQFDSKDIESVNIKLNIKNEQNLIKFLKDKFYE